MSKLEDKTEWPLAALVIQGGRTQLELEAVAALVDPARFHLAANLFLRLERRGALRCVPSADRQPDGKLTVGRLSSVFRSNTNHEDSQPCYLQMKEPEVAIDTSGSSVPKSKLHPVVETQTEPHCEGSCATDDTLLDADPGNRSPTSEILLPPRQ